MVYFLIRYSIINLQQKINCDKKNCGHLVWHLFSFSSIFSGKIALDDVFRERDALNQNIVEAINSAATVWGIRCLRYEIRKPVMRNCFVDSFKIIM